MKESKVTKENKAIYQVVSNIFGVASKVWSYADEHNNSSIDILICPDSPYELVTSYSTIGLSDYSINLQVDDIPLGIEIIGACESMFDQYPNILATCGFNIINSNFRCAPGIIFSNVIKMYLTDSPMQHILFIPPFGWDKEFETLHFQTKKVAWLLAVPISEAERQYANVNGPEALEKLFEEKQINIYDLFRKSVL
jgi:antitoxin YqcF